MKRILYITNVPSPYRIDFFNALGRECALTVLFEGKTTAAAKFFDATDRIQSFRAVFLSDGEMRENRVDRRIFRYLKPDAYDEIVATSYGFLTELAAILYLRFHRIPYWLELDGSVMREGESPIKRVLKQTVIRGAQGIFSTGNNTDRVMLHYGAKQSKLHRYPFSSFFSAHVLDRAPSAEQKTALRQALGIPAGRVVLAVGRFIYQKGFDVLLDVASLLPADTAVCLVGGVPTEAYREQVASLGLTNVFFSDFLPTETVRKYYQAADVFALPTREDIWGLVVNEAMACGLPVVTTDRCVAGLELIRDGENGYLIPADDAPALAARLNAVLSDGDLQNAMASACLDTIRGYTIERMVQAHMDVLIR